jgi:zinc/manganese transport system ATP-binding protein
MSELAGAEMPMEVGVEPPAIVVSARDLEVAYDGRTVWRDASFQVHRGEFVAVIGPNGAGKTTLFRLLLGLMQPTSGTLEILGSRQRRGSPKIGYVPQSHTIDNETYVECSELVRLAFSGNKWGFRRSSRDEREATCDALEAVGAADLARKPLSALSGGELQRIFLAEALVSRPDLLLLDEPLSNLDIRRSRELVDLVNHLVRSRKVTALLVAHDINPLIHFLDKVIYVANGRIATGTPAEVLTSEQLSALYGTRVEVLRDSWGHVAIVGAENPHEEGRP